MIFNENVQLDNALGGSATGLGLGLAIVRRVGGLLNHRVGVDSEPGRGSMFSIETEIARTPRDAAPAAASQSADPVAEAPAKVGSILVIEDDPEVSELLHVMLTKQGYTALTAPSGEAAFKRVKSAAIIPDLIVTDFSLGRGVNGLKSAMALKEKLQTEIPVIVLTGDITPETLRAISAEKCVHLSKPVNPSKLTKVIAQLLPRASAGAKAASSESVTTSRTVYVVDDETEMRETIGQVLAASGYSVESLSSCEAFMAVYDPVKSACLLVDAYLPGMSGLDLLQKLKAEGDKTPVIVITGRSDVAIAVESIKAGAADFLEKPVSREALLESIERAFAESLDANAVNARRSAAKRILSGLTARQVEIMTRVLAGEPSKNIAADLGISQRTVENHRAAIMKKTDSKSLPALARLAIAAG